MKCYQVAAFGAPLVEAVTPTATPGAPRCCWRLSPPASVTAICISGKADTISAMANGCR